jgi:dTMP kinase
MPSVFITFEGGEAAGKSTQLMRLKERMEKLGRTVLAVRDPGSTALGESIRELLLHAKGGAGMRPEAELLLFAASRAQLVSEVIEPALAGGTDVLSDRFSHSTRAYQGFGRGLDPEMIQRLQAFATRGLEPHLTIILDLDLATARRRRLREVRPVGPTDRIESLPTEFFERVREGYLNMAAANPRRIKVVNGGANVDEVAAAVWEVVYGLLL